MYVTATVQAGAVRDALTVPDAAILHDAENVAFVYLQTGGNKFARRVVKVADSYQGRTRVESGLQEGDKVVGDGEFVPAIQKLPGALDGTIAVRRIRSGGGKTGNVNWQTFVIHRIVQFALKQRFVVLLFTVLIVIAGAMSFSACRWTPILICRHPSSN